MAKLSSTKDKTKTARKKQLTARQKEIIQILTRFTASHPVTVAMISEMMGVSSRTILREIPHVEKWLSQNDFHFVRKPGVGLILEESVENQKLILELLEIESVHKDYSKEERRRRILGELLYAQEPLKSYYLLSKFQISEGTLSSDLDDIAKWLENYSIRLIRRPGLGVMLESDEGNYRQAIANVVYESMDEHEIMQLVCGEATATEGILSVHNRVFDLLDRSMMGQIEQILMDCAKRLHLCYTDSAYVGLIVHISLAVKRIQNNEKIEMDLEKLQKLMMLPEFSVAEEIGDRLQEAFSISIPRSEVGYITMHLSSARIWPSSYRGGRSVDRVSLRQLVTEMIDQVEDELGVLLHDSDSLLEDLCSHMEPAVSRLTMGVQIENSQLENIREEYPAVMQAAEHACQNILCPELELERIPESEVAFLAMHFGAAMEKKLLQLGRVSVMVVCPTGVGTSRILEASLKKEFPTIDVRGTLSMFRINPEELRKQGVDMIISTVQLETEFPWIAVNPILQAKDRRQIESILQSAQGMKSEIAQLPGDKPMTLDEIAKITQFGEELLQMAKDIRFDVLYTARSREEIIAKAGTLFATDDRMAADIEARLFERDQIADTYVRQLHVLLLHCRTDMVEHAKAGYIRLEPPVYEDGKVIFGALVMLAPEEGEDDVGGELIGAFGSLLVENKTLLDQLRGGDWDGSQLSIEAGLSAYYRQKVRKRLGVEGK
ncbi:MAG: BglG family transcription antiterminator [Butyricicoccus sp.]